MWYWSLLLAPWKDSNGGFCPKKKKENQMRADFGPGEEGTNGVLSPFTSFCACAAAEPWPQETPSDIKMD